MNKLCYSPKNLCEKKNGWHAIVSLSKQQCLNNIFYWSLEPCQGQWIIGSIQITSSNCFYFNKKISYCRNKFLLPKLKWISNMTRPIWKKQVHSPAWLQKHQRNLALTRLKWKDVSTALFLIKHHRNIVKGTNHHKTENMYIYANKNNRPQNTSQETSIWKPFTQKFKSFK